MKLYYVTLNTSDEARTLGRTLLTQALALCVNWFPITCMYRCQGSLIEEAEVVLIIKTQDGYKEAIQQVIGQHIPYTHFIGELAPTAVNAPFLAWLDQEIPPPNPTPAT